MVYKAMMRSLFVSIFCFNVSVASAQVHKKEEFDHHCKFEKSSLTFGLGAPFSLELSSAGVNLRMYYNLGEQICFGPEYSYFKNGDVEVVDFDIVGHYIFETKWFGLYPLVGGNYTVETEEHIETETIAELGMVFGGGIHRNIKGFTVFAEYSRVEFGIEDQFATFGLMYSFN
ncbi:MAG: hypothetical protein ACI9CP_001515 [Cryomorphaceae bacterium]